MKTTIITLIGLMSLTTASFAADNAETIFDNKCAMCHMKTIPTDMSSLVAPALMGVVRHVKMAYPKKEDAVKFMVDYVQYPSKKKSVCMAQKISRFGVMPSQKENITPQELTEVTGWMFDNFPPANFRGGGMMQKGMGRNLK